MVSDKYLKEYAYNIYMKKVGYSFERVLELFPIYYPVIYGYYQLYVDEERKKSATNITIIGLSAVKLLDDADKYYNKVISNLETLLENFHEGYIIDYYRYINSTIEYSVQVVKGYKQAKIYAQAIGATKYVEIADNLINDYTNYASKAIKVLTYVTNLVNNLGGQNG